MALLKIGVDGRSDWLATLLRGDLRCAGFKPVKRSLDPVQRADECSLIHALWLAHNPFNTSDCLRKL